MPRYTWRRVVQIYNFGPETLDEIEQLVPEGLQLRWLA